MKKLAKVLLGIVVVLALLVATVEFTGNGYLLKALSASYLRGYNSASIDDAKCFDTREITAATNVWEWPLHADYNKTPLSDRLTSALTETESVAFLVVKNDSIIHEYYWDGYSDTSHSNSFSMAKSVVTMLAQIAIQKGIFTSWEQPVLEILPSLTGEHASELQLWHLSTMSSGLLWDEQYKDPFSITAKAYYGDNIEKLMNGLPIVDEPGQAYNYQSGSTQLLAMALMKATGKPLAELASEWLWQPLQAKNDAFWHLDHEGGMELAYCCFNSNARDFARFGKLMVNKGNWNGTQILDSSFVSLATTGALVDFYGYSFWIDPNRETPVFTQRGILGQYIISIPDKNLVVVRLGHKRGIPQPDKHSDDFHVFVDEVLEMW
jgi:CubicO group peptidase (beta-lactamase class C family)